MTCSLLPPHKDADTLMLFSYGIRAPSEESLDERLKSHDGQTQSSLPPTLFLRILASRQWLLATSWATPSPPCPLSSNATHQRAMFSPISVLLHLLLLLPRIPCPTSLAGERLLLPRLSSCQTMQYLSLTSSFWPRASWDSQTCIVHIALWLVYL